MFTIVFNNKYYYATDNDTLQPTGTIIPFTTYPTLEEAEHGAKLMAKWHFYKVMIRNVKTGEEMLYVNGARAKRKTKTSSSPATGTARTVTSFDDILVGF